ncbi:MAG: carboxy terminal-processing peptidase [Proteobacteria bacterium]|nr:carboxy terminal-processing peptidase [Pseudomonadota bacterium]MBU1387523.1 carboxy terminal-processing peptidase [Pseudomonadota bacterium]MBU1543176.1 carboxy terminal-processing peptidase [Pseudomonadota bacterium]MBU2430980.1 carboxy terminal-processing peptidase [Pseudomonadota bacterium]
MTAKKTTGQVTGVMCPKIVLILFILFSYTLPLWAKTASQLLPEPGQTYQCVEIIKTLERYHYLEKNVDDQLSAVIFDRYLKTLDPGKQLFTVQDIHQFTKYKFRLDNEVKQGKLDTAFMIFNLYMDRSIERLEYISSLIKVWEKNFDFTKNETLDIDYESQLYKPDIKSLYPVWKKELKNNILSMLLEGQTPADITDRLEKIYSSRHKRLLQNNTDDVFEIFMNSVTASFDPHTQFYAPRASQDFDIRMSLSLEGIGAELQSEYEYTKVVRLIPKGPAEKSNLLMPGDKIIGVGQGEKGEIKDIIGQRLDHVVKLIRGPKNSYVRLKIIPAKKNNSTRTVQIKRDRVKLEEQSAKKTVTTLNQGSKTYKIGIIEIPNFYIDFAAARKGDPEYKSTTRDVRKLLDELKNENIDGLIIDLRNNGGGSLDEANSLTGLFLEYGPTVQVRQKDGIKEYYDYDKSIEYTGPLIVLINRMSASASEIFAAAIKDYNRGLVVGSKSFGKATVQELRFLSQGKLKLTNAKFYRVSGESTQRIGIIPDVKYPELYKSEDLGESALDGALPRDTINRTYYRKYRSLNTIRKQVDEACQQRVVMDPGFTYIQDKLQLTARINSEKILSLDLKTRKSDKELHEKQELDIENRYLKAIGEKPVEKIDQEDREPIDYKKILMDQTHLVMIDFISVSDNLDYKW